jgi:LysR family nitrogen assimilation transcriptional regulator
MEIRRLLYFSRIAEDGSLTKAAGMLRVAQPALSRQLRLLEEELGVSLFVRTARGMRLTEEGEYLREATTGPLRTLEFAMQNVRSLAAGTHGNIVVGMPSSLGDILATQFVLALNKDFPDIRLQVIEGATGSLIEWLNRGIIDCALLEDASNDDRLIDVELFSEPLMVIGAPASELVADKPVTVANLLRLPLILQSHHLGIRATVNQVAAKIGVTLCPQTEAYSARLIMDLVEHGQGYGVMPEIICGDRCSRGLLKAAPIVSPALLFRICLSAKRRERAGNQKVADAVLATLCSLFLDGFGQKNHFGA